MSAERPGPGDVDHLEPSGGARGSSRGSRRNVTAGIAAAAVLGVAGFGAWGVAQFLDGGTAAAAAVPANALAYVSVDLDPDGGQKLEAARTLRKFPAVREQVGSGDDLRRWIFDAVAADAPCELDFDDDIDPWLGNKMAFAVLPGAEGEEPIPMAAVEVKDQERAESGFERLTTCSERSDESPEVGTSYVDGFLVVAESDAIAADVVARVADGALADDDGFNQWVDEAGGSGIVTGYVSAEAPPTMLELMDQPPTDPLSSFGSPDQVAEAFDDFEGGALSVRFDDGALELEVAGGGMAPQLAAPGDSGLTDLPTSTALALGISFSDTAAEELLGRFTEAMGEEQAEQMVAFAELQTGLSLPEDLQTLLGDGLSVAVDGSIDLDAAMGMGGESRIPAGARIVGDPDEIVPVLEKLVAAAGVDGQVVVETGDGVVAFGLDAEHVAALAEDGALGDEPRFDSALPDLEDRAAGLYLDFDAGDWLARVADQDAELRENLEPLASLGVTAWQAGDQTGGVMHGKLRLTTD